jgi:hypothetical protein
MDSSLCPYKYLFGKPNESVHKYRILDVAIVDLSMTIAASYLIAQYYNKDFKIILVILILLGIISHRLFCVRTTVDKLLFR